MASSELILGGLLVLVTGGLSLAEPPEALLQSKMITAKCYLPDRDLGYYRGARFDWSGVISSLRYQGHEFFGVWFQKYDPLLHDAITGPVEEYRSPDGALGYDEAAPGDLFVKIGVGVLRKLNSEPYTFSHPYPIASTGKWIIHPERDRIEFIQELEGVRGWSYRLKKVVRLVPGRPEMILEHQLTNTGRRPIETQVYNHGFWMVDRQPTGPDMTIGFQFRPSAPGLGEGAKVDGNEIRYTRERTAADEPVAGLIGGFGPAKEDNDITIENTRTHASVRAVADQPISKLYLWSIRTTVCPEAYIALHVEPKHSVKWRITYTFSGS